MYDIVYPRLIMERPGQQILFADWVKHQSLKMGTPPVLDNEFVRCAPLCRGKTLVFLSSGRKRSGDNPGDVVGVISAGAKETTDWENRACMASRAGGGQDVRCWLHRRKCFWSVARFRISMVFLQGESQFVCLA